MADLPILIILLLLFAVILRLDFVFYIVYVIAGIYVWSRWVTPHAIGRLSIQRTFPNHAFLGERVRVTVSVKNKSRFPLPWVELADSVPPQLTRGPTPGHVVSVGRRGHAQLTYDIQATRRGYYRIGPLLLRAGDLFGWNTRGAQADASYLTVYPRIIPLSRLGLPSRLPFGTIASQQRLFEDPARPIGVRDYQRGDSLRQINWKVSAHSNNLVVRTLQPAISLDTAILLNLDVRDYDRRTRYSAPEWAIELAASVAAHLVDQQQAVGLMTNGADALRLGTEERDAVFAFDENSGRLLLTADDETAASLVPAPIPPRTGRPHLMKVLELLARVEARKTVPFVPWIPHACLNLSWGTTIPVITPVGDEAICHALHRLVRAGFNPILIVTTPTHLFGQIRERARRLGFIAFHIVTQNDLDEWQRPPIQVSWR